MSAINSALQWLGSEYALLWWLGIALKCTVVTAAGLFAARLIVHSRPDIRNLVLRQVVLLAAVLPVIAVVAGAAGYPGSEPGSSSWLIRLPAVSAGVMSDQVRPDSTAGSWPISGMIMLVLLAGVVLALLRIAYGIYLSNKVARAGAMDRSDLSADLSDRICALRANRRPVRVAFSRAAAVPFAAGVFSHLVVLPEISRQWKRHEVEIVLRHELLHIERHDNLWAFIASLATAVHWFNPLVWIARRQLVLEAERCCDAGVLSAGVDASAYAQLLITLARSTRDRNTSIAFSSQILGMKLLEVRIMSILQTKISSLRIPTALRWSALCCTIALLLPLTAMQLVGADKPSAKAGVPGAQLNPAADSTDWPSPDEFIQADEQPERLTSPSPVYPDSARKAGLEGSVWVKVLVDTSGAVAKAQVLKTSGHKILDDAALESAGKTTFKPAERNGEKLRLWVAYEIKFKLKQK